MKGLTTEMKEQVRSALIAYRSNYPTLNRAAESLQGVSSATVSQLCNGKYELISDEMFVRIAHADRLCLRLMEPSRGRLRNHFYAERCTGLQERNMDCG